MNTLAGEKEKQMMEEAFLGAEGLQMEQSYKPLLKVYDFVTKRFGEKVTVIDADDIQRNSGLNSILEFDFLFSAVR